MIIKSDYEDNTKKINIDIDRAFDEFGRDYYRVTISVKYIEQEYIFFTTLHELILSICNENQPDKKILLSDYLERIAARLKISTLKDLK